MPDDIDRLIDSLADLVRRHRNLTVRLARETGLAASHIAVLATLGRLGEVRLHTLAEELFVDPSVVSRHVSALEQEGGEVADKAADIIALNAGAALYVAGLANSLAEGVLLAQDTIASGLAGEKIKQLAEFTACF